MFIAGAGNLRYGDIVAVIDAAKGAGVEKVGIVTEGMRRAPPAATSSPQSPENEKAVSREGDGLFSTRGGRETGPLGRREVRCCVRESSLRSSPV